MNYKDYPENWRSEIVPSILQRARNKCEWCGIPNHAVIHRGILDKEFWLLDADYLKLTPDAQAYWTSKVSKIVLTVAHLDNPDPMDCRPENLACLCNRCHLNYDAQYHARNARRTRGRKKIADQREAGQMELFGAIE